MIKSLFMWILFRLTFRLIRFCKKGLYCSLQNSLTSSMSDSVITHKTFIILPFTNRNDLMLRADTQFHQP